MPRRIEARDVERLSPRQALVGESVRWDARRNALFYVDILGRQLRRYDPGTGALRIWTFEQMVAGWFPTGRGDHLLGMEDGLYRFSPETGALAPLCPLEPDNPATRSNDGRCDPRGRLWISTMDKETEPRPAVGGLYRLEPGGTPERILEGLRIPNTLAWSLDGCTMYAADTPAREVWRFDYDPETGSISNRRTWFALNPDETGHPDGACLDDDGGLWIAMPQGARIKRRMPDGSLDTVIETPCSRPTMCGFGGAALDTLYITSLSRHLTDAERAAQPDEGALFAITPGPRGAPEPLFGG